MPAAQLAQTLEPAEAELPAAQIVHVDDDIAPITFDDVPTGHTMQLDETAYCPEEHDAAQAVDPAEENCPVPQLVQELDAAEAE